MATEGPRRAPALTSLPRFEDIPPAGDGLDRDRVREALDAYRRHVAQLQAQLRVLQAAGGGRTGGGAPIEASGHAVRMDALHLVRAAAELADTIERDAQNAAAAQLARTEEEVRRRQRELQEGEAELERYRHESERQRSELLTAARNEARQLSAKAQADATREVQEAEARGNRLLEQARHDATELTNATRAEVEQTLEWARAQAATILARAQHGAEQLLTAAGLGADALAEVVRAIVDSAQATGAPPPAAAFAQGAPPAAAPLAEEEGEAEDGEAEDGPAADDAGEPEPEA